MRTIHIGISHDHNFVITKLTDVKVIAVPFGKTTAKCIDHGFDLSIRKHFIDCRFFYIQDLATDREDCLIVTVTRCLC